MSRSESLAMQRELLHNLELWNGWSAPGVIEPVISLS